MGRLSGVAAMALFALVSCRVAENPEAVDRSCDSNEVCSDARVRVLEIETPPEDLYTNHPVTLGFRVTTGVGTADWIELDVNGVPLDEDRDDEADKIRSPFEYRFDSTAKSEGEYSFVARTTILGRDFTSAPRKLIVDRTPPQPYSVSPPEGTRNADFSKGLEITLSEPLDPSTVSANSALIQIGGSALKTRSKLSSDGKLISVSFEEQIPTSGVLTGTLTGLIKDLAGNPLAVPSLWRWPLGTMGP